MRTHITEFYSAANGLGLLVKRSGSQGNSIGMRQVDAQKEITHPHMTFAFSAQCCKV